MRQREGMCVMCTFIYFKKYLLVVPSQELFLFNLKQVKKYRNSFNAFRLNWEYLFLKGHETEKINSTSFDKICCINLL